MSPKNTEVYQMFGEGKITNIEHVELLREIDRLMRQIPF
jgi:hypothetical protein